MGARGSSSPLTPPPAVFVLKNGAPQRGGAFTFWHFFLPGLLRRIQLVFGFFNLYANLSFCFFDFFAHILTDVLGYLPGVFSCFLHIFLHVVCLAAKPFFYGIPETHRPSFTCVVYIIPD